jgi:hypothetical protein
MKRSSSEPAIAISQVPMSKNSSRSPADAQGAGDQAADDRTGDADQGRDDEPARVLTGHDQLRDRPGKQTKHYPSDDSHETYPFVRATR